MADATGPSTRAGRYARYIALLTMRGQGVGLRRRRREPVRLPAGKSKSGESYVALIDADRLDYYHRLERQRIHLLLIDDARRGLADVVAGRTQEADAAIASLQKRRAAARKSRARAGKRG